MDEDFALEKFYVYRSLNNDETWGAVILTNNLSILPNVDFGMRVFAKNEKEAIGKAKATYDKIHVYDSDKENVRRFAAAALKYFIAENKDAEVVATNVMKYAVAMLNEYNQYFNELENKS